MVVSNLALPPQEVTFAEVKHHFAWHYGEETVKNKIKLKTWQLYCEGYTKGSRGCPKFSTFDTLAGLDTYVAAVTSGLLSLNDVGGKQKALQALIQA